MPEVEAVMGERADRSPAVEAVVTGDARVAPVVCVHPVSGRTEDYVRLADALAWSGPVLGIDAPAATGDEASFRLDAL